MKTKTKKHTPGPWSYHAWKQSDGTRYGIETADHRHGIAGIEPNGNASTLIAQEEHEANARLIAAAPELLSKLKEVVRSSDMTERGKIFVPEFIDSCRAAIAKAEGQEAR